MKRKITRKRMAILPRTWIYLFLIILFLMTLLTFLLTEQKYSTSRTDTKMNLFLPHEDGQEMVGNNGENIGDNIGENFGGNTGDEISRNIDGNIIKEVVDNKDDIEHKDVVKEEDDSDKLKDTNIENHVLNAVKHIQNGVPGIKKDGVEEIAGDNAKEGDNDEVENGVANERDNISKGIDNDVKNMDNDLKAVQNAANKIENDVANQEEQSVEIVEQGDPKGGGNVVKDDENNIPAVQENSENGPVDVIPPANDVVKEDAVIIPPLIFGDNGKGQNGTAVHVNRTLLSPADQKRYDEGYQRNAFNNYISDLISVDRLPLPTARDPLCLSQTYPDDLPDTSVIITFLNEAWSVLVRTIHSIIRTAPPHLLREIILVDDFSDYANYDYLNKPLEVYMRRFPKVKILRNKQREGLIRSRLFGAQIATGQVLTFLDSHIECATDWLPPLLTRIKQNSSAVVWPVIPSIDQDTFQFIPFTSASTVPMGVFDWRMAFIWMPSDVTARATPISPMRTPTMAGGLFSIDRNYFYHIGSYDDQMVLWGAENLEISFRIWMCGGTLEIIPCSVIAHIFRNRNVNVNSKNSYVLTFNSIRTAVVWMDEYQYLYSKYNSIELANYGDVSARVELRRKLQCKSFQWYLDNIFPEAFLPNKAIKYGLLHNKINPALCLHANDAKDAKMTVKKCDPQSFKTQVFYATKEEELRLLINCVDIGKVDPVMLPCHRLKGNQVIQVREDGSIYSPIRKACLQWSVFGNGIEMSPCDGGIRKQWTWEPVPLEF